MPFSVPRLNVPVMDVDAMQGMSCALFSVINFVHGASTGSMCKLCHVVYILVKTATQSV